MLIGGRFQSVRMNEALRSLIFLAGGFVLMFGVTLGLAWAVTDQTLLGEPGATGPAPSGGVLVPDPSSGIGGALAITGDRTATLVLSREVIDDRYSLVGDDGQIVFGGQPPTVARIQFDGLDFFLGPDDCASAPGGRDVTTGLAPLTVRCTEISDVRDTAIITVEGTLRVSAGQFGLRGDLPRTGGTVALGEGALTFDAAVIDLQRPEFIIDPETNFVTRFPTRYPVTLEGEDGTLLFVYEYPTRQLTLVGVELASGLSGVHEAACEPSFRVLGMLSPQVTVAEMTLDCPAVTLEEEGLVPLSGTVIVDVVDFPQ